MDEAQETDLRMRIQAQKIFLQSFVAVMWSLGGRSRPEFERYREVLLDSIINKDPAIDGTPIGDDAVAMLKQHLDEILQGALEGMPKE